MSRYIRKKKKVAESFAYHRLKLFLVHELELLREKVKVLKARVDVRLGADLGDLVKVVDVYMGENTRETLEDVAASVLKVLWELLACGRNQLGTHASA